MIRVLFIQNIEAIAGSENYFIQILPELNKMDDLEVGFFNFYKSASKALAQSFSKILKDLNVVVHECEIAHYASLKIAFQLRKVIQSNNYQIVHSHLIYADFHTALLKTFYTKFKFVSTLHGYQEEIYYRHCLNPEQVPHNLYYFLMKFAVSKMDLLYACSFGLKQFFEKIGLSHSKEIRVVHHGFSYPFIAPENVANVQKGKPMIAIVGRVIKRKGHAMLLPFFDKIFEQYPQAEISIVGDGVELENIQALAQKSKWRHAIHFLGYKTNPLDYMAAADVLLIPSYSEGLPLVIFEAFHAGVAVVAFDTIGCGEAIQNEKTGILIEPFHAEKMIDACIRLLQNETLRKSIVENAKLALLQKFSKKAMLDKTTEIYKELAAL